MSVTAPKTESKAGPETIEILGSGRPDAPGVTTQLFGRTDRRPGDRRRDRDDSRAPRERGAGPPASRETRRPRRDGTPSGPPSGDKERGTRPEPAQGENRAQRRDRPPRREPSAERDHGPARERRSPRPTNEDHEAADGARPKAKRLNPRNTHRQAVLDSLPPEQKPIAEQVLRGGIPAVRTALHLEREKAQAEGRVAPNTDQLIAMAESLLPKLKAAEWRDRAEAASADADAISLRDLRSVVAGADVARDEETRTLAASVREALERRVAALHDSWFAEIANHLDESRVVRALRLSARPPDPSARIDADLAQRLADSAGQAMAPDTAPDRWVALLDAVVASPVRRAVRPAGLPADSSADLKRAAHQHSGSIPALAKLLGLAIPPPPVPTARRGRPTVSVGSAPRGRGRNRAGSSDRRPPNRPQSAADADPPAPESEGVPKPAAEPNDSAAAEPETQDQPAPSEQAETTRLAPEAQSETGAEPKPESAAPETSAVDEAAAPEPSVAQAPAPEPAAPPLAAPEAEAAAPEPEAAVHEPESAGPSAVAQVAAPEPEAAAEPEAAGDPAPEPPAPEADV
jgi:hypothetical protein